MSNSEDQKGNYLVSILLYIQEEAHLHDALKSICSADRHTRNQVQLILLDSICSNDTKSQCETIRFGNQDNQVLYIPCPNQSQIACYNTMLESERLLGRYINFANSQTQLKKEALASAVKQLSQQPACTAAALTPIYLNMSSKETSNLIYKIKKPTTIALNEYKRQPNLFLPAYFLCRESISCNFPDQYPLHNEIAFLLDTLQNMDQYIQLPNQILSHVALEQDVYNFPDQYEKAWYLDSFDKFFLPYLDKYPQSIYVQTVMHYLILVRFACNLNDRHKTILNQKELEQFFKKLQEVLQRIDDAIIAQFSLNGRRFLPKSIGNVLLHYKYDGSLPSIALNQENMVELIKKKDEDFTCTALEKMSLIKSRIQAINYTGSQLVFDVALSNTFFAAPEELEVYALVNGQRQEVRQTQIYSLVKYFGISMAKEYTFQFAVELSDLQNNSTLSFQVKYRNTTIHTKLLFSKMQARLFEGYQHSYWKFGNYILKFNAARDTLLVNQMQGSSSLWKLEAKFLANILIKNRFALNSLISLALRLLYWLTKPFYRGKEIWLTFDQLFKCGDNGEYFYRYVSERKDKGNIKIYYIANRNAPEYRGLKRKYKTVLAYNGVKHRIVSLHAAHLFATRVDVKLYCGFGPRLEKQFRDLYNLEVHCLQHGLTIQRIAQYQNRLFDNTKLYFCASPYEIQNLEHPVYGYSGDVLKMTGAPRYDGLISKDKRQILISPTWRRNVTAGTNKKGSMHEYSPNFKHTEYFRIYNSLINDERLIACAKKNNYRLIYLLHPILSPQLEDFDRNGDVEIIAGATGDVNYEKMLTESSLMLTDYSGIQFDFAYMRKPLVYYHPETLPPQYDEGGLKYDTMGFGPVCSNHEAVIEQLCHYMEAECKMNDFYRERVDAFFTYSDHNNCQRIYETAVETFGSNQPA